MNGIPVSPSRPITASGLSTSLLPPKANCTSVQAMPASEHANRMASAPMSIADFGPKRPNGWIPTPMMATSCISVLSFRGCEGVDEDLGPVVLHAERHDDQLDVHPELQLARIALGQPGLDPHFVAELDEPHPVGREGLLGLTTAVR